jgi:hypothetical protein
MESVEAFMAERITQPLVLASVNDLRSTHRLVDVDLLPRSADSLYHLDLPLLWIEGRDLFSGTQRWVPYEMVHTAYTLPTPTGTGCFLATSNGLASGNHLLKAISHAICETVERDAATLHSVRSPDETASRRIDPKTVDDPRCCEVLDRFDRAGISVAICDMSTDIGIPAFTCLIAQGPPSVRIMGSDEGMGCHPDRNVALLRALTEAAQVRMASISGGRDEPTRWDFPQEPKPGQEPEPGSRRRGRPGLHLGPGVRERQLRRGRVLGARSAACRGHQRGGRSGPDPPGVRRPGRAGHRSWPRRTGHDRFVLPPRAPGHGRDRPRGPHMNEIYVFLGPTLAESSARAELDAGYLPPVSEGDVYRLWRRRPRAIGIVDGYFRCVPAGWHKEIMWMMERGVYVFGAAGLGALRAAELDSLGMRGIGWVYRAFRDGILDRDDEVAVKHGGAEDGYRAQSESMVNIRSTLQAACDQGIISAATRQALALAGTELFYSERTWPGLLTAAGATGADAAELDALRRWLPTGRIDQQADDAVAMLSEMRCFLATDPAPQRVSWTMAKTARWEAARRRTDLVPGVGPGGSPALLENVLDEVRLLGPGAFETAHCRSLLRVFAADFAEREGVVIDGERRRDAVGEFRTRSGLKDDNDLARFLAANDLSADGLERLVAAGEMVRWACEQAQPDALDDLLDDLRLHGDYAQLMTRARGKLDQQMPLADVAGSEQAAIAWYFAERLGTEVPADLPGYAWSAGFPDEQAFRKAVRQEHQYSRNISTRPVPAAEP